MGGDIDPSFTFFSEEAQTVDQPWEVGGALRDARDDYGDQGGTSIDDKIRRRLVNKQQKGFKSKPLKRKSSSGESLSSASEDESSDSSEQPLPGEYDSDDSASSDELVGDEDGDSDGTQELESDHVDLSDSEDDKQDLFSDGPGSDEEGSGSEGDLSDEEGQQLQHGDGQHNEKHARQSHALEIKRKQQEIANTRQGKEGNRKQLTHNRGSEGEEGSSGGSSEEDEEHNTRGHKKQKNAATGVKAGSRVKDGSFFAATPDGTRFSATSFVDLHLSRPLLKACAALGFNSPTPIQAACIPLALTGRDICGSAMTGSGKTAAFSLPCLERLLHRDRRVSAIYVIVLTPTRELAVQVHSMICKLAQFTDVRAALVVGGLSLAAQAATLRAQPEIVVATPGRFLDHLRNSQSVGLEDLQVFILDEADRLLEMGFADEIHEIVRQSPVKRQSMLFSATMTEEVRKLAALSLRTPVRLAADASCQAPTRLTQEIVRLKGAQASNKEAVLLALCSRSFASGRTIVFFKTKQRAHRAKILFGLSGLSDSGELHGDMTQAMRLESLEKFRKGEIAFLLCTDVASRGLDILGVETVINFDAPSTLTAYLHRIGRTARAGSRGLAVTIVEDEDRALVKDVVKKAGVALKSRIVPAQAVKVWRDGLERLEGDVERIRDEEREERMIRKAEMEAQKAENMVTHEAEIFSRPARTWFQTPKQKKEAASRARLEALGQLKEDHGEGDAKKQQQQKKGKDKDKEKNKRKGEEVKTKQNKLSEETQDYSGSVRAAKSMEMQLRQSGMLPKAARKAALAQISEVKKPANKKKKARKDGSMADGLFDGDGVSSAPHGASSHVYAGGARSGKLKVPGTGVRGPELNRLKRHGKGKHAFKSKARHKRRK